MKIGELRNLSKEDLSLKIASCKEELGKLNYLRVMGQVEKPHRFRELRKTIAQIHTILKEEAVQEAKGTKKEKA